MSSACGWVIINFKDSPGILNMELWKNNFLEYISTKFIIPVITHIFFLLISPNGPKYYNTGGYKLRKPFNKRRTQLSSPFVCHPVRISQSFVIVERLLN